MNFKQATCAVILALGSVLGVALSGAQQPGKMMRVGFLGTGPAPTPATPYAPLREFRQGLDELGFVDGRDVVIETRWADGRIDQLPALAAELVGLKVDIIVGVGAVVGRAAKSAVEKATKDKDLEIVWRAEAVLRAIDPQKFPMGN